VLCNWSETSLLRSHKVSNLLVLDVSGGTLGYATKPPRSRCSSAECYLQMQKPLSATQLLGNRNDGRRGVVEIGLIAASGKQLPPFGLSIYQCPKGVGVFASPRDTSRYPQHASCRVQTFHRPAKRSVDYMGAEPNLCAQL
jgi:hypothetical protein